MLPILFSFSFLLLGRFLSHWISQARFLTLHISHNVGIGYVTNNMSNIKGNYVPFFISSQESCTLMRQICSDSHKTGSVTFLIQTVRTWTFFFCQVLVTKYIHMVNNKLYGIAWWKYCVFFNSCVYVWYLSWLFA